MMVFLKQVDRIVGAERNHNPRELQESKKSIDATLYGYRASKHEHHLSPPTTFDGSVPHVAPCQRSGFSISGGFGKSNWQPSAKLVGLNMSQPAKIELAKKTNRIAFMPG